jgi:hypothetical protein
MTRFEAISSLTLKNRKNSQALEEADLPPRRTAKAKLQCCA